MVIIIITIAAVAVVITKNLAHDKENICECLFVSLNQYWCLKSVDIWSLFYIL